MCGPPEKNGGGEVFSGEKKIKCSMCGEQSADLVFADRNIKFVSLCYFSLGFVKRRIINGGVGIGPCTKKLNAQYMEGRVPIWSLQTAI